MIGELEFCLCIGATARAVAESLDQMASRHSLSVGHASVLLTVSRFPGRTQVAYSSALVINDATLTRYIDRLEDAELIERRRGREDRRVVRLYLTEAGQAKSAELSAEIGVMETALAEDMGAAAFQSLSTSCRELGLTLAKHDRAS